MRSKIPLPIRALALLCTGLILAKVFGILEVPNQYVWMALLIDIGLVIFELVVFTGIFSYFYRRNRSTGMGKLESVAYASIDEFRASTILPRPIANVVEKLMLIELGLYRKIGRALALNPRPKQSADDQVRSR